MTCIVAVKKDNKIYMSGDTADTADYEVRTMATNKIIKKKRMLIGCAGAAKLLGVIQYNFCPSYPSDDIMKYFYTSFIPTLSQCFKDYEIPTEDGLYHCELLIGMSGRLFIIDSALQVNERVDDFEAVGSGSSYALGVLYTNRNKNPKIRLKEALEASAYFDGSVRSPFTYEEI